ncbi:uncharacterized protein LOC119545404 [Choloepus didactylus]|uniref:uncharacterized protein LOC119545404 n=1 Tax=Choloepus didactylus TaxID=27675 RepID=UPI0018A083B7|nr:uncharacterized protein LOC119545404 [Choloepus didactylus]
MKGTTSPSLTTGPEGHNPNRGQSRMECETETAGDVEDTGLLPAPPVSECPSTLQWVTGQLVTRALSPTDGAGWTNRGAPGSALVTASLTAQVGCPCMNVPASLQLCRTQWSCTHSLRVSNQRRLKQALAPPAPPAQPPALPPAPEQARSLELEPPPGCAQALELGPGALSARETVLEVAPMPSAAVNLEAAPELEPVTSPRPAPALEARPVPPRAGTLAQGERLHPSKRQPVGPSLTSLLRGCCLSLCLRFSLCFMF